MEVKSKTDINNLKNKLSLCYNIYEKYDYLLNSYVLDFFIAEHWNKLSKTWQNSLENLNTNDLSKLLDYNNTINCKVLPLSLLTLKTILQQICLSRKAVIIDEVNQKYLINENKSFWKNIKAKKRHEIPIISKICRKSAIQTNCFYIVDVGSGLGHLSRILHYKYGFEVCSIEAQESLNKQAQILDKEFEKKINTKNSNSIKHINLKIELSISSNEFFTIIKKAFDIDNKKIFNFGIVGLHACGDLGVTLLKLYNACENIKYINFVGCCYMKLSTTLSTSVQGFPLSDYSKKNNYNLSYNSREIACHAVENFIEKLNEGEIWKLKIHCYRAVIEKIIVSLYPNLHHLPLSNVKFTKNLSFQSYCNKAIIKLNITLPQNQIENNFVNDYLKQWKKVVIFYSLRLLLAPLVETIILLDRELFIKETGSNCVVVPVFDSKISPRNYILIAIKK